MTQWNANLQILFVKFILFGNQNSKIYKLFIAHAWLTRQTNHITSFLSLVHCFIILYLYKYFALLMRFLRIDSLLFFLYKRILSNLLIRGKRMNFCISKIFREDLWNICLFIKELSIIISSINTAPKLKFVIDY